MSLKWIAVLGMILLAAQVNAQEAAAPTTQKDKISYGIGVDMAKNFKSLEMDLNFDMMLKAMKDVYSGNKLAFSDEELRSTLSAYQAELMQKQMQAMKTAGENNMKEGTAFMEANKTKEGVVTLPSGLQYKIIKKGEGKIPTDTDTVECNYRGTLINGTEFDSSYMSGKPAVFPLSGIIPGWQEALKLMPVGSQWQIVLPPQLAYGEQGAGRDIGPNATLIFEIELLAIKQSN
jgi:FKBP-type peptidyl-prolyl cis-trans isomerase